MPDRQVPSALVPPVPVRSARPSWSAGAARLLCGGAALVLAAALTGCGGDGNEKETASPAKPIEQSSGASDDGGATPSESGSATPEETSSTDAEAKLPLIQLQQVVEDHGGVTADGEDLPQRISQQTLVDTALAAFSASDADCAGELVSGSPVTCVISDGGGEGSVDGKTFTAYIVKGGGMASDGVLFVEGTDPLEAGLARLLQDPYTAVSGIESGVGWISEDRDPQTLTEDVKSVFTSPNAKLPWNLEASAIQSLTCQDGITARTFRAGHCSMDFADGLTSDITVLPANWVGAGSEPGPLVLAHGTP